MAVSDTSKGSFFETEKITKILAKIAPPVMLAQLIQALYNIVDSFFVGKYSGNALTALSVIYPLQLIIIALAVGTGVGVNTYMARKFALGREKEADEAAGTGMVLEIATWLIFALLSLIFMRKYVMTSAKSAEAIEYGVSYGTIVCVGSLGAFLEGNWSKVHQSYGNMKLPMIAQITGAVVNIILDPILIFGIGPVKGIGVAGAAYATIAGQFAAAVITGIKGYRKPPALKKLLHYAERIYQYGYPSIIMQSLYTVYIVALNIILASFSDYAVTVLGLYYKVQTFFFIPLAGLQTCIVPVLSYNFAISAYKRCKQIMTTSFIISLIFMVIGMLCFIFIPDKIIGVFTKEAQVLEIGKIAFPIIGCSFIGAVFSLMLPVFFQAIGSGLKSLFLSLLRQIFCLIPIFWAFSLIGLNYTWLAFPCSEAISGGVSLILYMKQLKKWNTK